MNAVNFCKYILKNTHVEISNRVSQRCEMNGSRGESANPYILLPAIECLLSLPDWPKFSSGFKPVLMLTWSIPLIASKDDALLSWSFLKNTLVEYEFSILISPKKNLKNKKIGLKLQQIQNALK